MFVVFVVFVVVVERRPSWSTAVFGHLSDSQVVAAGRPSARTPLSFERSPSISERCLT